MTEDILSTIVKELGEQHMTANRVEEIKPAHLLDDDIGMNSLDVVCVCVALEERYGIEIDDTQLEAWRSVACIVSSVQALAGERV